MTKNILYSLAGLLLGCVLGFFIANAGGRQRSASNMTASNQPSSTGSLSHSSESGQLPPGHPNINNTGNANSASALTAQSQAAMDEADRNPQDFTAQIRAAAIFFQLGSFDKATLYLNRSLALQPDNPDALTGMGQTKYETGDYAAAATYFEKVLAKNPNDADLHADLANTYAKRTPPDYERALAEYRKALEIDPQNEGALEGLAGTALRKGDKTTARDAVDKLAAVNPSNAALPSLRSQLETK